MIQKTLVLIKPDAFSRHLENKVKERITNKGYQVVAQKLWFPHPPRELIEKHYKQDCQKEYFKANCDFMTSGPVQALVYSGQNAISGVRMLQGNIHTPGTIRGDYATDVRKNLIHASDSEESAQREIKIWFPDEYDELVT